MGESWKNPVLAKKSSGHDYVKDADPDLKHRFQNGPVLKKSWTHALIFHEMPYFILFTWKKKDSIPLALRWIHVWLKQA